MFSEAYRRLYFGPSKEGRALTAALVGFMKDVIPGRTFDGVADGLIRVLNGDALADMLGIRPTRWTLVVNAEVALIRVMDRVVPGGMAMRPALGHWFEELIALIAKVSRGGKDSPFRIPQTVRRSRRAPRVRK